MGFLMGAYGKLMTGKLVRDIQFQMLGIQSKLRKVTREIGDKTKYYEARERNFKQTMQMQMNAAIQAGVGVQLGCDTANMDAMSWLNFMGSKAQDKNFMPAYSVVSQTVQSQYMAAQTMWQNMFEMQKQADLQALKDLEDDLQLQNDNLKSRLELAKQEYDAYKQEEKADAKSIAPEYTPSGG